MKKMFTWRIAHFLMLLASIFLGGYTAMAQDPSIIEGRWLAGFNWDDDGSSENQLTTRTIMGTSVNYSTIMAEENDATCDWLFIDEDNDYSPKWGAGTTRALNTYHANGAIDNGADGQFDADDNEYYMFMIEDVTSGNADMSILSIDASDPEGISIDAVTKSPASPTCGDDVTVTADLDIALRTNEHLWLAYTTDNWSSVSFLEFTSFNGSFESDQTIPAQTSSTTVKYYVFTSPKSSMSGVTVTSAPYLGFLWSAEGSYTVAASALSVDTDPSNSTICSGDNTTFSITASGTPNYQWQENSGVWSNLSDGGVYSNVTTSTLTLTNPGIGKDDYTYRCVISKGECADINSDAGTLVVNSLSLSAQPSAESICDGDNASFSVTSNGQNTPTYKWQESTDNGSNWSNLSDGGVYGGTSTATLSLTNPGSGKDDYDYRCILSITSCSDLASSAADLSVSTTQAAVTGQPSNASICDGDNTTFTVTGSNVTSYKWQESTDNGSSWSNISDGGVYSNSATATLTLTNPSSSRDGYDYRCVLTNTPCSDAISNSANLDVNTASSFSVHPSGATMGSGGSVNFTATADNSPTYQWQESTDNESSWSNLSNGGVYSNVTTATMTITSPGIGYDTYDYRVVATASGCASGTNSNAANLTVERGTTGSGDGSWDDPSQWREGSVPSSGADVIISHNTTLDQDATVATITIDAGATLTSDGSSRRLSVQSGGTFTNNGTFTGNTEIVDFEGAGTVDGSAAATFNDVEIHGTLTLTAVPTINGTLDIQTGNVSASPNYGSSSTLKYNTGGTYGRNVEWDDTDSTNPGFPHNVVIDNNTTFNMKNGTNADRFCGGSITVESGSTFDQQDNTGDLSIGGDLTIEGTFKMSTTSNADTYLFGDYTNNGTYTPNDRSLVFSGTQDPQLLTENSGDHWDYFSSHKTSGNVKLMTALTINGSKWFTLHNGGGVDLNDQTLTLESNAKFNFEYAGTSTISNSGAGTATVVFEGGSTFDGVAPEALTFDTGIKLESSGQLGNLSEVTINGELEFKSGGYPNGEGPVWGSSSLCTVNTGGDLNYSSNWNNLWNNTLYDWTIASGTTFRLDSDGTISSSGDVTVNGSIIIHDGSANRDMDWTNLTIGATGTINMNNTIGADMFISGDFTCTSGGTFTMDGRMMEFDGNGTQTVSGDFGAQKWNYVNINNSHATQGVELECDVTIDNELRLIDGYLMTKDNYIVFDGTSGYCDGAGDCNDGDGDADSHIVCDGDGGVKKEDFGTFETFTAPIASAPGEYAAGKGVNVDDNSGITDGTLTVGLNTDMTMSGDDDAILNPDDFVQTLYYLNHTQSVAGGIDITLYWHTSDEGGSFTRASAEMYHLDGSDDWVDENATTSGSGSHYYVDKTVTSFSPFAVGDDAPAILPIELADFWVEEVFSTQAVLQWVTVSEVNNDHFVVERSVDGVNYEQIGELAGAGMSSEETFYEFVDHGYSEENAVTYYRLKQVDVDGASETFDAVAVQGLGQLVRMKVIPNPVAHGQAPLLELGPRSKGADISIMDMVGRTVWTNTGTTKLGHKITLPLLSTGSYLIRVQNSNAVEKLRFIVTQ